MYPFLNDQFYGSLKRDLCWNYKLYAEQNLERGMVITFKYVVLRTSLGRSRDIEASRERC